MPYPVAACRPALLDPACHCGNAMPIGSIILWFGAVPPHGWCPCDGRDGRPDLTGHALRVPKDGPKQGEAVWIVRVA